MEYRVERDSMGEMKVPADVYWGAQTQRSYENFRIGSEKMPPELIRALGMLKKAAAMANYNLGKLDLRRRDLIIRVCDELEEGRLDGNFPLSVWQTGSGTQTNMNVNEVIANRGNRLAGESMLHPNDHVNMSQSSNDVFPSAMHLAAVMSMDATPIGFSQEISGWREMTEKGKSMIEASLPGLRELALGGTAVGTGLNTPRGFSEEAIKILSELTDKPFIPEKNKFHGLSSRDALVFAHGALKALAANMMKMANDIRWLASGPRCGLGEITIPENEPGSSIMPGKVNPTQCEAMTMIAVQVMGNDTAVGLAASQGNFELNVFMPVCIYNFLQSVNLLADGTDSFCKNCVSGIKANRERMDWNLHNSLMLVTALNPYIGYDNGAKTAKKAYRENISLRDACAELGFMSREQFAQVIRPEAMI